MPVDEEKQQDGAPVEATPEMLAKVDAILDKIRPHIRMDGGDVELVGIEDGVVLVRLMGGCVGCPMSTMTLKAGIERIVRNQIPEIRAVEAVM